jgi:FkbH-like protein
MNLLDALELLKQPISKPASTGEVYLACGFTPLHLKTFLAAHLRLQFPQTRMEIKTGLYGDLIGNLERFQAPRGSVVCTLAEWADLDPRLGIRSLGSWRSPDIQDIVSSAHRRAERLNDLIQTLAESVPVYVSTPTLPLPPVFTTGGNQAHHKECELRAIAASLAASLSACKRVKVVSIQRLDGRSPLEHRFDPRAEITSGFPFSLRHASQLAELLAALIRDEPPKKGLITDLDDTLWAGIVGDIGVDGVSWNVSDHTHAHGLYQRFLASLASAGVLLAAASKNDSALVEQVLDRPDILLSRDTLFPLEINWGPKSASVSRILIQWNIAPDDVVFVDDSPMEVDEVHAAFPQMECIAFPKGDHQALWRFLQRLRDQFGRSVLSTEDDIRLRSIRATAAFRGPDVDTGDFLRRAAATITFSLTADANDSRARELINKTNQFNLNGRRYGEAEWLSFFQDPSAFLLTANYEDKYGPLGKIAAIMGKRHASKVFVTSWALSCRAFSRRVEYQCLKYLFDSMGVDEILFDYSQTPRNGPIQEFFIALLGEPPSALLSVCTLVFHSKTPPLFHRVVEVTSNPETPATAGAVSLQRTGL